jgi:4-hydroxy-3-methylbut-2-enyl diphosphate reductase
MTKPPLTVYLAAPRGFCAGVDRAIKIVEMALEKWGAPVFVRHEIVHNKFVVDDLRPRARSLSRSWTNAPTDRPVIFSAHGVPKAVPAEAARREMLFVDATCPLVSKVHIEAARHHENGLQMIMIGHEGHPETVGTMGQLPEGEVLLVETVEDVATVEVRDPERLAFVTQTTLSVDDTPISWRRFRRASRPSSARTRKTSVTPPPTGRRRSRPWRPRPTRCWWWARRIRRTPSGWSRSAHGRLPVCAAGAAGARHRLARAGGDRSLGITAGASAPEVLVNEVIDAFRDRYDVTVELVETAKENVEFKVPRVLRVPA